MEAVIRVLGTASHLENLAVGIVTVSDLVYYLSGILICLLLAQLSIETR